MKNVIRLISITRRLSFQQLLIKPRTLQPGTGTADSNIREVC